MMGTIILRDIRIAFRTGGHWLLSFVFFVLFLSLCGIALGGQISILRSFAVPLTWLAFLFAALLSARQIFRDDMEDGSLAQFKLSGVSFFTLAIAKTISFSLLYLLPLILITPIAAQLFGLGITNISGLIMSLLIGLPAIAIYMGLSGALLCGQKGGGFLAILIAAPLLIPTLIFGVATADEFIISGLAAAELRVLLGLSFIAVAVGIPAITAALYANLE